MSEVTQTDCVEETDEQAVARLADGVSLCGEYEGSGFDEPRYLISRGDGQMVLVSPLLYQLAAAIDGTRQLAEVAARVSQATGKEVSAVGAAFLINEKLHPLGVATLSEPIAEPPKADPLLSLAMHGVFAPARVVRVAAAILAPLYAPVIVILVLCGLLAFDAWLIGSGYIDAAFQQSVGEPAHVLLLMGLVLASTLFHEVGHAAGCHYGGAKPGAIGVGIMLIIPCFYTNVTDAYRLDRRGRLRTDLGGVYFNAIFILAMAGIYDLTHFQPLLVFIALSHIQMLQQMLPLLRMDGYYILGDLVGVPNLFSQVAPFLRRLTGRRGDGGQPNAYTGLRPRVRIIVAAWVLIVVPTLLVAVGLLLWRLPVYLSRVFTRGQDYWTMLANGVGQGHFWTALLAVVAMIILLLPWVGATAFVVRVGRRISRRIAQRKPRSTRGRHRAVRA
ncbi:hypothetical protein [Saccharopolyspora phatthalungensis]|uniref:Putative peptide zinc metalloprotease protein n=1 Tax=Saccharopolyspora phatthalungensis TaxID=664693 RepID=A0A840QBU5_9PSEU|nr:hypothetical protein [Saccharopolyspora phatthalungensis]MBB5154333.1 putative peptide zinc metalloprotease protein [Saccharopolyspora phatthalungensis]